MCRVGVTATQTLYTIQTTTLYTIQPVLIAYTGTGYRRGTNTTIILGGNLTRKGYPGNGWCWSLINTNNTDREMRSFRRMFVCLCCGIGVRPNYNCAGRRTSYKKLILIICVLCGVLLYATDTGTNMQ